jgi:chorismate dehydratase
MKRFLSSSSAKLSMEYKKNVPSYINKEFISRRVDAAFISSIAAKKQNHVSLGIVAKSEVLSVLVVPHAMNESDSDSATSNILARILNVEGKVLIGDKALRYYLTNEPHIDLAKLWNQTHHLPFVFALLCYHKDKKLYKKIQNKFLKTKIKIPQYLLKKASLRTHIQPKEILLYLEHISYHIDKKAELGLKKFYNKASLLPRI